MADITPIGKGQAPRGRASGKVVKKEESVHVNFRANPSEIRQLDEMVAGRYDPSWRTRSDGLDAALQLLNMTHFQRYIDQGHRDVLHYELYTIRRMRETREEEIRIFDEEIEHHHKVGNVEALKRIFIDAYQALNDINQDKYGDQDQKKRIEHLIKKIKGYIAAWDSDE